MMQDPNSGKDLFCSSCQLSGSRHALHTKPLDPGAIFGRSPALTERATGGMGWVHLRYSCVGYWRIYSIDKKRGKKYVPYLSLSFIIYPYLNDIQFRILPPSILEVPVFQWISNGSPLGLSRDFKAMPGAEISRIEGRGRVNVSNVFRISHGFSMSWEQGCSEI